MEAFRGRAILPDCNLCTGEAHRVFGSRGSFDRGKGNGQESSRSVRRGLWQVKHWPGTRLGDKRDQLQLAGVPEARPARNWRTRDWRKRRGYAGVGRLDRLFKGTSSYWDPSGATYTCRTFFPFVQVRKGTKSSREKYAVESCLSQKSAARASPLDGGTAFFVADLFRPIPLFLMGRHIPCGHQPENPTAFRSRYYR